jgi:hypothetical protein
MSGSERAYHFKGSLVPAYTDFVLGLLFDPKNGGDMFLKNVRLSPNCVVLQPRRLLFLVTTMRTSDPAHIILCFLLKGIWVYVDTYVGICM